MLQFNDFLIQEALKIVKKKVDKDIQKQEPKQHDNEDMLIGKVGKYTVIKTNHIGHTRDYEKQSRDAGLDKKDYLRVIQLFVKKRIPQDGKRYHLFYKNKKGTYDNLVVAINDDKIVIVTVMQFAKKDVEGYFSKDDELRLKLENNEYDIFLMLD